MRPLPSRSFQSVLWASAERDQRAVKREAGEGDEIQADDRGMVTRSGRTTRCTCVIPSGVVPRRHCPGRSSGRQPGPTGGKVMSTYPLAHDALTPDPGPSRPTVVLGGVEHNYLDSSRRCRAGVADLWSFVQRLMPPASAVSSTRGSVHIRRQS